jgi:hypothetical protein
MRAFLKKAIKWLADKIAGAIIGPLVLLGGGALVAWLGQWLGQVHWYFTAAA